MAVTSLKSKVVSGLKWNSVSVLATKGTDFIVKLILARLLVPDAFGIIGMAMVIIGFLGVVSDMGLFNALVQKKQDEHTEDRLSSAFWLLLALAISFVVIFYLLFSPFGASFYNEPRLVPILNTLSLYLFFNILSIVPRVLLTRRLAFKSLVKINLTGTMVSSITAIALAVIGYGVWSLVIKYLIGSFIVLALYWFNVGWYPRFTFKGKLLTRLAGYSTYTQINNILFYFRTNIDYLIIGKLVSAHTLGIYTLAFTLSEILRAQLYSIFNKVFFPVYSSIQNDRNQIKFYYLKVMQVTAMLTFPISVLCIGLAEEIILVFFGKAWIEAAKPLRILSIASIIFSISGTPAEVLKGIGKPSVSFYLNLLNTFCVALPLIYFGLKYYGLVGVAYAVCVHYLTSRLTFHHFMKKYIGLTNKEVYNSLKRPSVAAATMLGVIYTIKLLHLDPLYSFMIAGIVSSTIYSLFFLKNLKKAVALVNV